MESASLLRSTKLNIRECIWNIGWFEQQVPASLLVQTEKADVFAVDRPLQNIWTLKNLENKKFHQFHMSKLV